MLNCFNIIDQTYNKNIKDIISLTYDQRFIRRKKVKSDNGIEFLVNLPETKSLNPGQAFELDNLDLIKVLAKVEDLLEIQEGLQPQKKQKCYYLYDLKDIQALPPLELFLS